MQNFPFRPHNGNFFNNPFAMMQKFNEFRQSITGNPRQIVQQLLNSGVMSQSQFNTLSQMANEFLKYLPK